MLLAWRESDGTEVITSSWTAWGNEHSVDVAYLWGADGVSWLSSAVSTRRVTFAVSLQEFYARRRNDIIDLR